MAGEGAGAEEGGGEGGVKVGREGPGWRGREGEAKAGVGEGHDAWLSAGGDMSWLDIGSWSDLIRIENVSNGSFDATMTPNPIHGNTMLERWTGSMDYEYIKLSASLPRKAHC